ncbi:hypothetical protein KPH14_006776 [Odynerus spinipes]|uniref:Crossover junction endonuclease EME1 n=1 Tax=Odynerus spinipes TaxID=1348599 RepID=A0AAD9RR38_9HYME|nr:hypothetical protein KPH14_006776 [Odynerus spinipes]
MSHVIVLSDSDESESVVDILPNLKTNNCQNDSMSDDFEFPEVQFDYVPPTIESLSFPSQIPEDYTYFLDIVENNEICTSKLPKKRSFTHDMSDSSESELCMRNVCMSQQTQIVEKPIKKDKNKLKEERLKRQENLAKEKALKTIAAKKLKDIRPGECMKFMTVILDKCIKEYTFYSEILTALSDFSISYNFISHIIPKSITWERNIEESSIDENNKVCTRTKKQTEKYIIVIWQWSEAVEKLIANTFCSIISSIRILLPDYNMTLVIFGLEQYFTYHKKKKKSHNNKGSKNKSHDKIENFETYKESPEISKQQLDACLVEIQIIAKCNTRLIENPSDLALMVYQYTKAIAEIPYKLEKKQHFDKEFNWYIAGDNRDTVRVDKDGNGLKRLWQQQLCQFNLSSLEVAEAICTVYKSPAQLVEAYKNCTPTEGSKLLENLPIRRAAGPLTAIRRVGPELSKRIHVMYTSEDGDVLLGNGE